MDFLVEDTCVIHIPAPGPGRWEAVLRAFCSKYVSKFSACGETALTPWELVLTARGEPLVAWASVPSTWEVPA